jgi:hypothetical protein
MAAASRVGTGLMPKLHVDIDARGRVVPRSAEARRALAGRAGRFELLPSASDLLVARRTPAVGGTAPTPRCILAGDLAGFPIADFFALVHQSRLSGVLTVAAEGVERAVSFQRGEVRSARSTASGERIEEVVVRLGYATEAQIARASADGRPVEKALVEDGVVGANDMWKCLHEQVIAVFHAVLLSPAGTFFVVDGEASDHGTPLTVNTQSLLMNGLRRIDELSLFQARIPGPHVVVRRRAPPRPTALRPAEDALLDLVDGARTVAELATGAHLSEFDATKLLHHLVEAGYVEVVAAPLAGASAEARVAAILSTVNGLLRAITAAVPVDARGGFLDAARQFLREDRGAFSPLLAGLAPAADGSLDEAELSTRLAALDRAALERVDPSGDPAAVLLGSLREALSFWLFLAGGRVAPGVDDSLALAAKRELARLAGGG